MLVCVFDVLFCAVVSVVAGNEFQFVNRKFVAALRVDFRLKNNVSNVDQGLPVDGSAVEIAMKIAQIKFESDAIDV